MASSSPSNSQFPPIHGILYTRGLPAYEKFFGQYATTSYDEETMRPKYIIQPFPHSEKPTEDIKPDDYTFADIKTVLQYAGTPTPEGRTPTDRIAVAIRTGGHQYSGASSTGGYNIQLDLSSTFRYQHVDTDEAVDEPVFVTTGVSFTLKEFNAFLASKHLFVPHGQCAHVCLGGHVQTGGYGQLGRSFGLLGDHVRSLWVVDYTGTVHKEVTKDSDPELFFALLGGSPGNLGVITHLKIEVYRDRLYQGCRGQTTVFWWPTHSKMKEQLKHLLDLLVEMSDDDHDYARNYDMCISVVSSRFPLHAMVSDVYDDGEDHQEIYGKDKDLFSIVPLIIVYAQWVPFGQMKPDDKVQAWFNKIKNVSHFHVNCRHDNMPMSKLTGQWLFNSKREYELPYIKRTQLTNKTTLGKDGWPGWMVGRIDNIISRSNVKLVAQIQCFGGKNSQFVKNADNGTSFSWRDSTIVCDLDCFYSNEEGKKRANDFQLANNLQGIGSDDDTPPRTGIFSNQDRRVLWGSFGDTNLDEMRKAYYETEAKYIRLSKARLLADPEGIFTPNTFCVKTSSA